MPPTAVAFPSIVTTFKTALAEVLGGYFNNATHRINDINIPFPAAKIAFDVHAADSPLQLTIAILGDSVTDQREEKCENPKATIRHGVEVRANVMRTVIIASAIEGGVVGRNRQIVDDAWSKLYAVFAGNFSIFAARGIYLPSLSLVPDDITIANDLAEASGIFKCEVRAKYARYNVTP